MYVCVCMSVSVCHNWDTLHVIILCSLKRIVGPLGSGHFSVVSRGIWKGPSGQARDVAVKSLACTDQLSKVKFLQEAVIMGQFKHPNVVQLCGSVTEGDAVSSAICMQRKEGEW